MRTIILTSGEPSGIGPDICLDAAIHNAPTHRIILIGDADVLQERASLLKRQINIEVIDNTNCMSKPGTLQVLNVNCPAKVIPGKLNPENALYVLNTLDMAVKLCQDRQSNIIVTAPVSKEVINQAGIKFSGHTEYFADKFGVAKVVMMLANEKMKVALLTTHLPLKDVPGQITPNNLNQALEVIVTALHGYGIAQPKIAVCGLNPHAGEGGYLGMEEINIINPLIKQWQARGYAISGTYPADTIFLHAQSYDLILAMYHDQGLPVLKYSGFESGINVTLGLPVIRTSVDHGTALDLAATGMANSSSLIHALQFAINCDNNPKFGS